VAQAAPTLLGYASNAVSTGSGDGLELWRAAFALTYSTEIRAERQARPGAIVDTDPERYRRFGAAALPADARPASSKEGERSWRRFRRRGKAMNALRLVKASATFANGIDYLAWKINRHAGTAIEIKPWQRRWPLVAGLILLPRLLKRGAIR
jgi:hypothetical protein